MIFCSLGGGKRSSASKINRSFQNGSHVLLVGSTCWWFGSSGADTSIIHLLRLWYVANSSTLVSAWMCR